MYPGGANPVGGIGGITPAPIARLGPCKPAVGSGTPRVAGLPKPGPNFNPDNPFFLSSFVAAGGASTVKETISYNHA